jgi:hypothetical protein
LGNDVAAFGKCVMQLIKAGEAEDLKTVLGVVEKLITGGDADVRTATATNCLENIMNRT